MSRQWFKFYGAEYLSDPKMMALSPCERSCWITLLSLASVNDNDSDNGKIMFLDEHKLMLIAGLDPTRNEWEETQGVLQKFKKLKMITFDNEMITLKNWRKRQETNLTGYERVKRHREKKRLDNKLITPDKNRVEESRIDITPKPPLRKELTQEEIQQKEQLRNKVKELVEKKSIT